VEIKVIPIVKSKLPEEISDDSNFADSFADVNRIKSKLNQFLWQYPEIDALMNDILGGK
jgi:hypothetical protein